MARLVVVVVVCVAATVAVIAGPRPAGAAGGGEQTNAAQTNAAQSPYLSGLLSTYGPEVTSSTNPSVPGIYDSSGRFVLLHGVNAVYKRPPYELTVAPGKPWNFDARDAAQIASFGFNVVRLGILWQGIEPGTAKENDPRICTKGTPGDPGQWNQAVADRYIRRVVRTVDLLGRYHIYTLLDMHQDVYSQAFKGEGAPRWAVCTNGLPLKTLPGRWSNNYASPALNAAFGNFWSNDVVGNLQGEFDRSWTAVAAAFKGNPWIAGYDPINEPFTTAISNQSGHAIDDQLECFYTGRSHPGTFLGKPLNCGPDVPAEGVIPSIRSQDPNHMIFLEPTIFQYKNVPNFVGPIPYPNLVLNFHAYCGARSPRTGNPSNTSGCFLEVSRSFLNRSLQVVDNPSAYQPLGLPIFLSEFGATQSAPLVADEVSSANLLTIGWAYWSWKYYNDPTGSSKEALVAPDGRPNPQASALEQAYPEAVSGTVVNYLSDSTTGILYLSYVTDPKVTAPTLIWVPVHSRRFSGRYCAKVGGATVVSAPNAQMLEIRSPPTAAKVVVAVAPERYCG